MKLERPVHFSDSEVIWKSIENFEGLYEVSNTGKIKALEKIRKTGRTGTTIRIYEEKIMKPSTKGKSGYEIVTLRKNKTPFYYTVHSLVAKHFIPNNDNKCCVNHIDSNKLNNNANNLEWVTHKENSLHAFNNNNQPGAFTDKNNISSIKCINITNNKIYISLKEAWKETKYNGCYETFLKNIRLENNNTNCKII